VGNPGTDPALIGFPLEQSGQSVKREKYERTTGSSGGAKKKSLRREVGVKKKELWNRDYRAAKQFTELQP